MAFTFAGQVGPTPALSGADVLLKAVPFTVFLTDGVTLATLYTDRTKGTTTGNPSVTDALGNMTFYAAPDQYKVVCNGTTLTVTVPVDPADVVSTGNTLAGLVTGLDYTGTNGAANITLINTALAAYNTAIIPPAPVGSVGVVGLSHDLHLTAGQRLVGLASLYPWQTNTAEFGVCLAPATDGFTVGTVSAPIACDGEDSGVVGLTMMGHDISGGHTTSYACAYTGARIVFNHCTFMDGTLYSLNDLAGTSNQMDLFECQIFNSIGGGAGAWYHNSLDGLVTSLRKKNGHLYLDAGAGGTTFIGGHLTGGGVGTALHYATQIYAPVAFTGTFFDSVFNDGISSTGIIYMNCSTNTRPTTFSGCKYFNSNIPVPPTAGHKTNLFVLETTNVSALCVTGGVVSIDSATNVVQISALIKGSTGNEIFTDVLIDGNGLSESTLAGWFPSTVNPAAYDFTIVNAGAGRFSNTLRAASNLSDVASAATARTNLGVPGLLTPVGGVLGSPVTFTNSVTAIMSTSSLGAGVWVVIFNTSVTAPATNAAVDITIVAGTATGVSFTGPPVVSFKPPASATGNATLPTIVTIGGAGTLTFNALANNAQTYTALATSVAGSTAGATGWIAYKVG